MSAAIQRPTGDDARMWAVALIVSVLLNLLLLVWVSIEAIQAVLRQQQAPLTTEIRFYDQSLADVVYHLH